MTQESIIKEHQSAQSLKLLRCPPSHHFHIWASVIILFYILFIFMTILLQQYLIVLFQCKIMHAMESKSLHLFVYNSFLRTRYACMLTWLLLYTFKLFNQLVSHFYYKFIFYKHFSSIYSRKLFIPFKIAHLILFKILVS